mgnify:CR=1 FL=1
MRELQIYKPLSPFTGTQGFGQNLSPLYKELGLLGHNGFDAIRGCVKGKCYETEGANVRAAHDGEVIFAGVDSAGGYFVELRTLEMFTDKKGVPYFWKTIYYHLRSSIKIKVGQRVRVGDILGLADNTGRSNGSHLHFGLKRIAQGVNEWSWVTLNSDNGYWGGVDPLPYFDQKTAYEWKIQFEQIMGSIWNLVALFQKS